MLIDVSFFTEGPRQIQNASTIAANINSAAVNTRIEGYIKSLENHFMSSMVGCGLASLVLANKGDNPIYREIQDRLKQSFADYVFFHMLKDMNSTTTVTGLVQLKCANSYISPVDRQVSIWNGMVDRNREFVDWAKSDECPVKIRISSNMLSKINNLNL